MRVSSISKVRITLRMRSRHGRRGWRHLELVDAEKSKERLFEEVRFKDRFGCVKIEAQILNCSQLLSRYNTAIKLGFEALGGTELADPWGFFMPFTSGRKSRKSSLLEQFLRITCIRETLLPMDLGCTWSNSKPLMPPFGHVLEIFQWSTRMWAREPTTEEGWIVEQNKNKNGKM